MPPENAQPPETGDSAANFLLLVFLLLPPLLFIATSRFFKVGRTALKDRKVLSLIYGNGLVLLFLLSVAVLGGEIYFRFFYDSTDSFGLCKTTTRWFERHFERNKTGFRDSFNYLPTVEPGKHRVTFIGDSFTAGHGIPDVENRFANIVRRKRSDWEVHVLAECGWDTSKEMELLFFLPKSGYETNTVVLVYCLNDIADITPEWQQILDRIYKQPDPGFLAENSYLFNTISARLQMSRESEISNYYGFIESAYDGAVWRRHKDRLERFRDAAVENGAVFCVVTFPFLHAIGKDYPYKGIHQQLDNMWKELEVPHLDLLPVFADQPPSELVASTRDAHPNERAHALAADAITEFLAQELSN